MTTAKDATARPTSQHRPSFGSTASSLPPHKSRTHSHSLSMGSLGAAHRVSRRKSMSSSAHNNAAMAAAMKEKFLETSRRPSKASLRGSSAGNHLSPGSLPHVGNGFGPSSYAGVGAKTSPGTAITDGPSLSAMPAGEKGTSKARIRRASEGSRKRVTHGELRCENCGKGYKHSSCLTKHLWEHTPQWGVTSKLLISKHQQVQMLEAASVLVAMNQEPEESKYSDHSSASPPASSSDAREDSVSSTETSPGPETYTARNPHRYSGASSAYSHSYQSGNSIFSESAPSQGFASHHRQWSSDGRPTTSGTSIAGSNYGGDDESADLVAAVNLLSCSQGSNKSGPTLLPPDVPPVPPVPARYLDNGINRLSGSQATITPRKSPLPDQRAYSCYRNDSRDVRMREDDDSEDDFDQGHAARNRVDEHEDLMFGRMEE
ncbi:hypothetical protein EJ05DRAFT_500349 [Pseudovirgaria hyperparasitica]|uniref:C2H2-type domain-containing protein n=1 Tax=Pseudovirgaria hyperparasitica TaxID=470096 RepID=A0A6A6W6J5_9PEZI|nr:uncharacterized protein EJ05DRAFT_500349 [Pseudovirgaria hyperparasitica]KAF2757819.1 hypothetical protein EJ05DRAFT_500349 [Pseudovirgaria hyperparasitica]